MAGIDIGNQLKMMTDERVQSIMIVKNASFANIGQNSVDIIFYFFL